MSVAEDYFARVRPLLGDGLSAHGVRIDDAEVGLLVLELLASCMLQRVVVTRAETRALLVRQHRWKQPFDQLRTGPEDERAADATIIARRPAPGEPTSVVWNAARHEVTMTVDPANLFAWMDVSYHVARTLREAMLGRAAWPDGTRWHDQATWPFSPRQVPGAAAAPDLDALRGRHILVIGCGSLGSEAIRALAGRGARWTLIDDACVTVWNLARQWYGAEDVGRSKVDILARRLAPERVHAWRTRLDRDELGALEQLVRDDPPDVVLLATGTHHHGMIGELLWRLGIPHVAACCYPQARYFEVSIVSPGEDTPCLHCFRGHLYRGAAEPPPITDEVASFLYAPMDDARRARSYADLVAEPATKIETLRAAELLARCAVELCATRRDPWFARALAAGTTCLLGGNVARVLPDGSHAYGIREPGQVIRLGLEDVIGAADIVRCDACGRHMDVALRDDAPAIDDTADHAML